MSTSRIGAVLRGRGRWTLEPARQEELALLASRRHHGGPRALVITVVLGNQGYPTSDTTTGHRHEQMCGPHPGLS